MKHEFYEANMVDDSIHYPHTMKLRKVWSDPWKLQKQLTHKRGLLYVGTTGKEGKKVIVLAASDQVDKI